MTTPIGWNAVQDAMKAAVVATNAVAAGAVAWADEKDPAAKVKLILNILYADAIQDREDVDVGPPALWTLSTLYYIRVQVRAESIFSAPGSDALFALEKARAGMLRPDVVLDAGVILQPDDSTYVHHLSFPWDGRTVSAYAFEVGFRAVIDYALTGTVDAAPNMVEVDTFGTADTGELTPAEIDSVVVRP